jgi:hypothetical protein
LGFGFGRGWIANWSEEGAAVLRPYKCKNNRKRRRGRTEVRPYKRSKSAGLKTRRYKQSKSTGLKTRRYKQSERTGLKTRHYKQSERTGLKTRHYKNGQSPIMMRLQKCLQNEQIGIWRRTG